jgi:DNA-binding SARP family transcriptional activator
MANLQKFIEQSYDALLQRTQDVPIVLLHPQSNYRSVVVARLMAESPKPVFYHALASYDVNVEAFLSGLAHNLSLSAPTFGWHLSKLPPQTTNREQIVASLLDELAELTDDPFFLVLDHYDASDRADDVQELLEALLVQLPAHCQVIINSRTLPRMPWLALVARRVAVILGDQPAVDDGLYRSSQRGAIAKLDVRCLGPSTIHKDGKIIDDWEGHLPRLLLIFALERPVVTRAEICQTFWPNLDSDQAVNVFHVTKRRLHKALGFDALIHEEGYYRVNPDMKVRYDVGEFVSALIKGRLAEGDAAEAAWQTAVDSYEGPFLQGHSEEWIKAQREAYQLGYLEAMMALANNRLQSNRPEHALRLLTQASNQHVEFEPLHREIMKLYASLGRRSEAASHYQMLAENLKARGREPVEETTQLYQELMA